MSNGGGGARLCGREDTALSDLTIDQLRSIRDKIVGNRLPAGAYSVEFSRDAWDMIVLCIEDKLPRKRKMKVWRFTYSSNGVPCIAQCQTPMEAARVRNSIGRQGGYDLSEITEHEQEVS